MTEAAATRDTLSQRQKLVGRIVRHAITDTGLSYVATSTRWPIALPTLNRLMRTGNVGLRFFAQAERNLGLPDGLLGMVIDGDLAGIRTAPGAPECPGLTSTIRGYVITELGGVP